MAMPTIASLDEVVSSFRSVETFLAASLLVTITNCGAFIIVPAGDIVDERRGVLVQERIDPAHYCGHATVQPFRIHQKHGKILVPPPPVLTGTSSTNSGTEGVKRKYPPPH